MERNETIRTVERAKTGDKRAFALLYRENYDKIYRYVLKNVGRPDAAEDITQEVFLQSMQNIGRLEKNENYAAWLRGMAHNKCADMFRSESRFTYYETDEELENAASNTGLNEPVMIPEDYSSNRERQRQLAKLLDGLKPEMRSALILYYYDDKSLSEVARSLGMNENAAKQTLFRARKKLKTMIENMSKKGVVLSAVPMESLLHDTVSTGHADAVRYGGAASVKGGTAPKVVAVSAAAAVIVGVPVMLGVMGSGDKGITGDKKLHTDSAIVLELNSQAETTTTAEISTDSTASEPVISEESVADIYTDEGSMPDDRSETGPEVVIPEAGNTTDPAPDNTVPTSTEPVEMSVEKMLSSSVEDLKAIGGDYEIVEIAESQALYVGYKFSAFPDYVFITDRADVTDDISDPQYAGKDYYTTQDQDGNTQYYVLGDKLYQLDLYGSAYVGSGVSVGMTYNDIEAALGQDIFISCTFDSIYYVATVEIDGRSWNLHFVLTDEQAEELYARLQESTGIGEINTLNPGSVDISDMDPVCDIAIYIPQRY
ncbi:MAG: RNA polymerase sigma factor [Ruminococcus sp.]|nr:RNA polymerase sigma factor [Ruminococcus sp.]